MLETQPIALAEPLLGIAPTKPSTSAFGPDALYAAMSCGIVIQDVDTTVLYANDAAERILAVPAGGMLGRTPNSLYRNVRREDGSSMPDDEWPAATARRTRQPIRGLTIGLDLTNGERRWLRIDAVFILAMDGTPLRLMSSFTDLTACKHVEEELRASEQRFRALSEHATDLVTVLDGDGLICYSSPSHQSILGYAPESLLGVSVVDLLHPDDVASVQASLAPWARGTAAPAAPAVSHRMEARIRHADGSWRTLEVSTNDCRSDPAVRGIIVNSRDVSERKRIEQHLRHLAHHDMLTGLPNRALLYDHLAQELEQSAQHGRMTAALFLDLDGFKAVNDTLGHDVGDLLLQTLGRRLCRRTRDADLVARLAGDEFLIVLSDIGSGDDASSIAQGVLDVCAQPFQLAGHTVSVTGSIGIGLGPLHGHTPEALIKAADAAMYQAKHSGRNQYRVSDEWLVTSTG